MLSKEMRRAVVAAPSVKSVPLRRSRGPWVPSPVGPYKLPRDVLERLTAALRDFRNRDAALELALFVARYWSSPARLVMAFPIDRRALAEHPILGLTEARVRGAIAALEAVGFLDRAIVPSGSSYRATEHGLHRKPVLWRFGSGYGEAFARANARSRATRGAPIAARRPITPTPPAVSRPDTVRHQLAQKESPLGELVLMGDRTMPSEPNSPLESALARFRKGVFEERGGED